MTTGDKNGNCQDQKNQAQRVEPGMQLFIEDPRGRKQTACGRSEHGEQDEGERKVLPEAFGSFFPHAENVTLRNVKEG